MADRLTQLQDCLDDLLTQMYASLNYIQVRHAYAEIEGQPSQAPQPPQQTTDVAANDSTALVKGVAANGDAIKDGPNAQASDLPLPDPPHVFHAALRDMAQELIIKEQQIEHLINSLPGLGNSESDQERRMRELEAELREVEAVRERKEAEREQMISLLGQVITKVKTIP